MELTYTRLHLFLLLPLLALAVTPPRPLQSAPPQVQRVGYRMPLLLAAIAFAFSCTWDILLAWRGVWTVAADMAVGSVAFMPLEEYLWFVDHTLLACVWVLVLWSGRPTRNDTALAPRRTARVVGAVVSLLVMLCGLQWLQGERTFYLGVILSFMSPVIGFQWLVCGHLLLQQPREWLLGIAAPSAYLLLLDTWALREGVWRLSERYTTEVTMLGVPLEHLLLYTVTTTMVVLPLVSTLRMAEIRWLRNVRAE
jgi:lycopene cyclase domain-containing protein